MSLKRLLPGRWLRIIGWALAGVSWGTTAVAVAAGGAESTAPASITPDDAGVSPVATVDADPVTYQAKLPDAPANGLVILRFTPVERPEAQVITRTVTVSSPASAAPARSAPAPVTVTSSGS